MKHQTLLELSTELEFSTEWEYFDYIIDSHLNGQPQQVKQLFDAMQENDRNHFVHYLCNESLTLMDERSDIMQIILPRK